MVKFTIKGVGLERSGSCRATEASSDAEERIDHPDQARCQWRRL